MVARIGSGGSGAPVSAGVGAVSGFGSIIVNGQHYDETGAQIDVDERPDQPTAASVDAMRLGIADSVRAPVEPDHAGDRRVRSDRTGDFGHRERARRCWARRCCVNADRGRADRLRRLHVLCRPDAGAIVEVHGQRNAAAEIQATRIELRPAAGSPARRRHRDGLANGTFRIGALTIRSARRRSFRPARRSPTDSALPCGRIRRWSTASWSARVIRIGGPAIPNDAALTVEGVVTALPQQLADLRIGGIAVDASGAQFVGGIASDLRDGRQVRASGSVTLERIACHSHRVPLRPPAVRVELTGAVTGFVDANSVFRVRDTATRVTPQTTYVRGDATNLGDGVLVKVEGPVVNGVVEATTLEFLPPSAGIARVLFGNVSQPGHDRRRWNEDVPARHRCCSTCERRRRRATRRERSRTSRLGRSRQGRRHLRWPAVHRRGRAVHGQRRRIHRPSRSTASPAMCNRDRSSSTGKTVVLTPTTVYLPQRRRRRSAKT